MKPNLPLLLACALPTFASFSSGNDAKAKPDVLFDLSFTRQTEGGSLPQASLSQGKPIPLESRGSVNFEPDLVAHSGVLGIRIGPGQAQFSYEGGRNLNASIGMFTLRFAPGRPGSSHSQSWPIFSIGEETRELLELQRKQGGGYLLRGVEANGGRYQVEIPEPTVSEDAPLDLDIRYNEEKIQVFINSKAAGGTLWSGAPVWKGAVHFGTAQGTGEEAAVLVAFRTSSGTDTAVTDDASGELAPGQAYSGEISPWWKSGMPRLGLEALSPNWVPKPFTPVEVAMDRIRVWGRVYQLSGEDLVHQITSAGKDLLSAPITLTSGAGKALNTAAFGPVEVVEQGKGRVILKRSGKVGNRQARVRYTIEYDGMLWIDMELEDADASPLALKIPMASEAVEYLNYVGAPHRYESQNLARNSNSARLPENGQTVQLPFKTHVWLGNSERGLQWFTESDRGWWPVDRKDCIEVSRNKQGAAELVLKLREGGATAGQESSQPLRLSFGLMATPVKAMPEGWRGWTLSAQHGSPKNLERRGSHVIYWPDEWRSMSIDPEPHRAVPEKVAATQEKIRADKAAGRNILPYWSRIHLPVSQDNAVNPDAREMVKRWGTTPNRVSGAKLDLRRVSMASAWTDYLVWCFEQWGEKFGNADGIYLDETQPIPNLNTESSGGYEDESGKRRPTFELFGSREYMKRIGYLVENRTGQVAQSVIHNSSTYCMPYMSEYAIFLSGEQMNSGYFTLDRPEILPPEEDRAKGYYYTYVLPLDRLIAEGYWQQWGVPIAWLPQLKNQKDIANSPVAARDLLSLLAQVDALIWPLFINQDEVREMLRIRKEFGIEAPEVEFIPFWRNDEILSADDQVKVSYYKKGETRLVLVSNLNRRDVSVQLRLNNTANLSITNAASGERMEAQDSTLTVALPRNDYRAFIIRPAAE